MEGASPAEVRRLFAASGLTKKDLAERAGLHPNTLRHMDDDDWSPTWKTLSALRDAMATPSKEAA